MRVYFRLLGDFLCLDHDLCVCVQVPRDTKRPPKCGFLLSIAALLLQFFYRQLQFFYCSSSTANAACLSHRCSESFAFRDVARAHTRQLGA